MIDDNDYEVKKATLIGKRAELILAINAIGPGPQGTDRWTKREELQADLRNVNAELKQLNIEETNRQKAIADARKTRGQQEHDSNLARAVMKAPASVAGIVWAGKKQGDALNRGEFLLKEVVKIGKTIATIKNPEPFTLEFKQALDKYIVAQRKHVLDRREEKRQARIEADFENADPNGTTKEVEAKKKAAQGSTEDWSKTWKEGAGG